MRKRGLNSLTLRISEKKKRRKEKIISVMEGDRRSESGQNQGIPTGGAEKKKGVTKEKGGLISSSAGREVKEYGLKRGSKTS